MGDETGDEGSLPGVKGIDVESAVPHKSTPIIFSADTCPPELARIEAKASRSELEKFALDYSFDVWSYGMLLYELATGQRYFDGKAPGQITRLLAAKEFKVDVSAVQDDRLRDLIEKCLSIDPKKRPTILQILVHPYFLTTGIGPYGFSAPTPAPAPEPPAPKTAAELRELRRDFGLTGQSIVNGKYLLCTNPERAASGSTQTYRAYVADSNGDPSGSQVAIKLSPDCESISQEVKVYDRITSGVFSGRFVNKIDYISGDPSARGSRTSALGQQCAIVFEAGRERLVDVLNERGGQGFDGRPMRDAAAAAAQCIQAMHSSGIVWSDLKAANFVVVGDETGDKVMKGLKAFDVANATPLRSNPSRCSPEASPPEFARASSSGELSSFTLEYSFDIWSYGMFLYQLATGQSYFSREQPGVITRILAYDEFNVDVSDVEDSNLRDLIEKCLNLNPKGRPTIEQVLLHPYFVTTGVGPFSFRRR
eukprot:gnl/TRDRNA2_/TRDRNA2_127490_c0_seq1.p1 gnl/TRDRNA2_/TRDRNA2_127490_c0~~gnl/TRDRNA2_/TRDRNA2_127490_c0_seq1.p1  ORF type:complete len:487 (-),score=48.78 gnl/TRDRNA2_/TRDRNA2_127490_c0_seq1:60-1499(-)